MNYTGLDCAGKSDYLGSGNTMDHVISTRPLLALALIFCFIASAYCDCGRPPPISYGSMKEEFINKETFKTDDTVQYSCRPGFIHVLGTRNTITCMRNSRWTTPAKFCTERSCGHPGDIENGNFETSNFLFGSKVTYYCNEGYKMISSRNYRICQADGTWSNALPVCEVVVCPEPEPFPEGNYFPEMEEYNFMDTIHYQCNSPKSVLYGETYASCTHNGTWSSKPPKCIVVECPAPVVPAARKVSGFVGPYPMNSLVTFECLEGFIMNGARDVKCNIHSQWEPSLPRCERNFCYPPHLINGGVKKGKLKHFDNGTVEEGFLINDSVKVDCNSNFVLNGESTLTCKEDLKWHPELPICEKRYGCSSPKIPNGRIRLKNGEDYSPERDGHAFSVSDKIHIQCDEGYTVAGSSSSSECQFSWLRYKWLPELPSCQR
ncbi:membrane cofactor protein-like isoform X2 [Dendropsophus ebraccatus]